MCFAPGRPPTRPYYEPKPARCRGQSSPHPIRHWDQCHTVRLRQEDQCVRDRSTQADIVRRQKVALGVSYIVNPEVDRGLR